MTVQGLTCLWITACHSVKSQSKQLAIWGTLVWHAGKKSPLQNLCSGSFQKSFQLNQLAVCTLDGKSLELQALLRLWTFSLYCCEKLLKIIVGKNCCEAVGLHSKLYPCLISASFFFLYIQFMCNLVFSAEGCE